MERSTISQILPLGIILPLVILLGAEFLVSTGLRFYNNHQQNVISEKKSLLDQKENEILNKLKNNEGFFVFSQYANISELAKNRYSFNLLLERFNLLMPQFLIVKNFSYDDENKTITLKVSTLNWDDYFKFYTYLKNNDYFKIDKIDDPKLNEQTQTIDFNLTLKLKPKFFEKQ